jgi:hypothetical protein
MLSDGASRRWQGVRATIGLPAVSPSKVYGWDANYLSGPAFIQTYLHEFDTIKQELRVVYDLK